MIRYYYIEANRNKYPIAKMVRWAKVSKSGYYAWRSRKPSLRDKANSELLDIIKKIHENQIKRTVLPGLYKKFVKRELRPTTSV